MQGGGGGHIGQPAVLMPVRAPGPAGRPASTVPAWDIQLSELNCPHVLERTLAATQSMNMLLTSLRDDLRTSARIPQPQASAVRREIAAKLRRAMLAFRRSFDDIQLFARTIHQAAARRAAGPKPVSVVRHGQPPQRTVVGSDGKVRVVQAVMRTPLPQRPKPTPVGAPKAGRMEVIELSDSDDEQNVESPAKATVGETHKGAEKGTKGADSKAGGAKGGENGEGRSDAKRKRSKTPSDSSGSGEDESGAAKGKKFQLRIAVSDAKRSKTSTDTADKGDDTEAGKEPAGKDGSEEDGGEGGEGAGGDMEMDEGQGSEATATDNGEAGQTARTSGDTAAQATADGETADASGDNGATQTSVDKDATNATIDNDATETTADANAMTADNGAVKDTDSDADSDADEDADKDALRDGDAVDGVQDKDGDERTSDVEDSDAAPIDDDDAPIDEVRYVAY